MKITPELIENLRMGNNPALSKNITLVIMSHEMKVFYPQVFQSSFRFEFWFRLLITRKEVEKAYFALMKAFVAEDKIGDFYIDFDKCNGFRTIVKGGFTYTEQKL